MLKEDIKTTIPKSATLSDNDFAKIINAALDLADRYDKNNKDKIEYSDDLDVRVKQIKDEKDNAILNRDLEREARSQSSAAMDKVRERERDRAKKEITKYSGSRGLSFLADEISRAVKSQVIEFKKQSKDSWAALNRRHEDDNKLLIPGIDTIRKRDREKRPNIMLFIDQSPSWGENDVECGKKLVADLKPLVDKKLCDVEVWYFATNIYEKADDARACGNTAAWPEIYTKIKQEKPKNVLIMTDGDLQSQGRLGSINFERLYVDGYVWFVWKNAYDKSEKLTQLLFGKQLKNNGGNRQFVMNG